MDRHNRSTDNNGDIEFYVLDRLHALGSLLAGNRRAIDIGNFCPLSRINMVNSPLTSPIFARADHAPVEWLLWEGLTPYEKSLAFMEARAEAIAKGEASECVLLVEHPALYTGGTSAAPGDLLDRRFPVFETGRGGQYTYHGPGQRVAYVMLDLKARKQDVRAFVNALEAWVIESLGAFNLRGFTDPSRVGVWLKRPDKGEGFEDKIAAIGIRLRKWVSFHGISLNVEPDLSHFAGIVPCGIREQRFGVTSLVDLGLPVGMDDADLALKEAFGRVFGR
jgi:lipoyl(octanoyl) transferase